MRYVVTAKADGIERELALDTSRERAQQHAWALSRIVGERVQEIAVHDMSMNGALIIQLVRGRAFSWYDLFE